MMGRTHALGGATALAGAAILTQTTDQLPLWTYGLAAVSALVPDSDNGTGTMMNRSYLLPLKGASFPLWYGSAHRTRSHSLLAVAGWAAIAAALAFALNVLSALVGSPLVLPIGTIALVAGVGYASHLALDMLNIPGVELLWPLPIAFFFPPWRAKGFIPGRFNAASNWASWTVWLPMVAFMGWYSIAYARDIAAGSLNDHLVADLIVTGVRVAGVVLGLAVGTVSATS